MQFGGTYEEGQNETSDMSVKWHVTRNEGFFVG